MRAALMALAMLAGCDVMPKGAVPLANAIEPAQAIYERWGERRRLPPIYGVPWNCSNDVGVGFRDIDGECQGGVHRAWQWGETVGVFVVIHPDVPYSEVLPHELLHEVHGDSDHDGLLGVWGEDGIEGVTQRWLAESGFDAIPEAM